MTEVKSEQSAKISKEQETINIVNDKITAVLKEHNCQLVPIVTFIGTRPDVQVRTSVEVGVMKPKETIVKA